MIYVLWWDLMRHDDLQIGYFHRSLCVVPLQSGTVGRSCQRWSSADLWHSTGASHSHFGRSGTVWKSKEMGTTGTSGTIDKHENITISQKNAQTSKSKRDDVCSIFPDLWPSHFSRSLVSFWVSEPVRIFCFQRIPGYLISRSQGEELLARLDTLHAFLSRMTWQKAEGHDMTGFFQGRKVDWSMWFCVLLVHWGWWQGDSDHLQLESSECVGESSRVLARIKWQYHFAESWRRRYAMGSGHDRQ